VVCRPRPRGERDDDRLGDQRRRAVRHGLERRADGVEAVFGGHRERGEHHDDGDAELGAAELGGGHVDRLVGGRRAGDDGGEADGQCQGDERAPPR
jgi:hypothetical protein